MASRTPRFTRQVTRQVAPIDPLAGAAESELAQELEAFAERRSADLDRRAAESGFTEGLESADISGNEATIRGRAINRGAIAAQQAAQQTDIRDSVERFELENDTDPAAFDAKVEGLLEGILGEADPRLHPFIRQRTADYSGRAKTRIIERQQAELEKAAVNDLERGAEGMLDDATTAAFEGDILMVEARRQEIDVMLQAGVDAEFLQEGAADEIMQGFERQVTAQEVIGNFDRLVRGEGPDAGAKAIGKWQKTKPSSVGLTAEDHAAVTRQMVTLRNREISLAADVSSKALAAARAETNLRQGRVKDGISVLSDGFALDAAQSKQITEDIAHLTSSGDADDIQRAQEFASDYDVANAIQSQVHRFRRLSAANRDEELVRLESDLRSGGASAEEVALLKALQKTSADVNRALETDPRGYLQREGLVEDPALDFSSAEGLAASIAARDTDAGSQLAGEPIGKLTAAEADQFAQIFTQAEIEEQVALLGVITAGSGEDAEATLQQIDSKGHDQMALLGGYVMQGRGLLAREILRGSQILAADPGVKPKRVDYQFSIDDQWGGAMTDWPEQRATLLDAAFAKYAELKSRTGDLSDVFDPKAMQQALDAVMPTARFNGRRVAIPAGITDDRFEDWIDTWDETTFEGVAGSPPDEMLELVRDDGRLVELGNGRYGVAVVSAATGLDRILIQEDGTPFMLQFPRPAQ